MRKIFSKKDVEKKIDEFFDNIKAKNSKEVKKIRKLAMSYKIKLGDRKRFFCKRCLNPYNNPLIRIKKGVKITTCNNCRKVSRWKIK